MSITLTSHRTDFLFFFCLAFLSNPESAFFINEGRVPEVHELKKSVLAVLCLRGKDCTNIPT